MKRLIITTMAGVMFGILILPGIAMARAGSAATAGAVEFNASDSMAARDLAKALAGPASQRPLLLHIGFSFLYHSGHIPGSRYIGAASTKEGLAALRKAVKGVSKDREIVVYCGCCPFKDCPNVRPAMAELHRLGYRTVRALYLPKDFNSSWADKGLPVAKGN